MRRSTSILFIFLFLSSQSHAGWFWETGKLVCETRMNGENCWWQESNPAPDQYDEIQTELYNLYSKALRGQDSNNGELQLLQHGVMKLVEESANLLQQIKMGDSRQAILEKDLVLKIQILQTTVGLFASTVRTPKDYWSSKGPLYISTLRKDEAKAKCLSTYLNMALQSASLDERVRYTETGFINCKFMAAK